MNINEYISLIESIIHSCSVVANYNLNIDRKTSEIAYICGKIEFRDNSILDFKEFVESADDQIEKYKYSYNYRINGNLIFRYDNAADPRARKLSSFPHHKHLPDDSIVASHPLDLAKVLDKIEKVITSRLNL